MNKKVSKFLLLMAVGFIAMFSVTSVEARSLKKGEKFENRDTGKAIQVVSSNEVEMQGGRGIYLGKYTIDSDRVRIVVDNRVQYYKITSDGLVEESSGRVFYSKERLAAKEKSEALLDSGNAYYGKGQYDRAIEAYSKAISLKPDKFEAYHNRGLAYYKKGQYDRAIENYNKAISLKPDFADAYTNRGIAYLNKGQYDRALEDYNKALSLKAEDANVWYNRACLYSLKKDKANALSDLKAAIYFDIKYKDYAKTDKDFKGLWDDKDFKKIVE